MTIRATLLADSVSFHGYRLSTFELEYPKFIHPQLMSHREFSRNVQSSRAIPTNKLIKNILDDPAVPLRWGINKPGMEASEYIDDIQTADELECEWLKGLDDAIARIGQLELIAGGQIHKQTINRLLDPWMHVRTILSGTSFSNLAHLRISDHAQPEIRKLVEIMVSKLKANKPEFIYPFSGRWHLPLLSESEKSAMPIRDAIKVSVGRCARVSYLTHDGSRDHDKDIELHDRLSSNGHWSPFEHVARPMLLPFRSGNFIGWRQYRKDFANEYIL